MKERKAEDWLHTGFIESNNFPSDRQNQFSAPGGGQHSSNASVASRPPIKPDKAPQEMRKSLLKSKRKSLELSTNELDTNNRASTTINKEAEEENTAEVSKNKNMFDEQFDEGDDDNQGTASTACGQCCSTQETFIGMKIDSFVRLYKVVLAFPFVIVVSSLNLSTKYSFLR